MTVSADTRFWDRLARKYAKKPVPDEDAYRLTLERVAARLEPGHRVLEVGCGTGTTALKLAPRVADILATDVSAEMIAIARKKAEDLGANNVRFAAGTLADPALEFEPFDVVMAFNLFHLLEDISGSLTRIRELLKPGGLFISKTPCVGERGFLLRGLIPVMRAIGKAPFVNFVKKRALEEAIVQSGFEILETGLYPARSHSLFVVARRV